MLHWVPFSVLLFSPPLHDWLGFPILFFFTDSRTSLAYTHQNIPLALARFFFYFFFFFFFFVVSWRLTHQPWVESFFWIVPSPAPIRPTICTFRTRPPTNPFSFYVSPGFFPSPNSSLPTTPFHFFLVFPDAVYPLCFPTMHLIYCYVSFNPPLLFRPRPKLLLSPILRRQDHFFFLSPF